MPPVGQNRACGNGPPRAFSAAMPPAGTAGKNFAMVKPAASTCINSLGVAMPGMNAMSLAAAARSSSGVAPGLSAKRAPRSRAASRSSGVSTVPIPTTASGTSAMIARAASRATGVRRVISRVRMPPATRRGRGERRGAVPER